MIIEALTRTVYRSPRAGRSYLTLRAAVHAEARKIIQGRYPSEQVEYEDGHVTYPGFHWTALPRQEVMLRRLARLVRKTYEARTESVKATQGGKEGEA